MISLINATVVDLTYGPNHSNDNSGFVTTKAQKHVDVSPLTLIGARAKKNLPE